MQESTEHETHNNKYRTHQTTYPNNKLTESRPFTAIVTKSARQIQPRDQAQPSPETDPINQIPKLTANHKITCPKSARELIQELIRNR